VERRKISSPARVWIQIPQLCIPCPSYYIHWAVYLGSYFVLVVPKDVSSCNVLIMWHSPIVSRNNITSELSFRLKLFITFLLAECKNEHTVEYHVRSYCHLFECDYRQGLDWILDLLTTFTHDSWLHLIIAPSPVSTLNKALQHTKFVSLLCLHQLFHGNGF
jgi:hypothetical protein